MARSTMLKHVVDRLVAGAGLLVTAPVFLAIALQRHGLVRREMIGEHGRAIMVRSFDLHRSRLLAAIGAAALPQLWSVVRGEMSLVGPRPREPGLEPPPARPGLTGLAQLEGPLSLAEQHALDAEYARTRSVRLDVAILWRTLSSRGGRPRRPR